MVFQFKMKTEVKFVLESKDFYLSDKVLVELTKAVKLLTAGCLVEGGGKYTLEVYTSNTKNVDIKNLIMLFCISIKVGIFYNRYYL